MHLPPTTPRQGPVSNDLFWEPPVILLAYPLQHRPGDMSVIFPYLETDVGPSYLRPTIPRERCQQPPYPKNHR